MRKRRVRYAKPTRPPEEMAALVTLVCAVVGALVIGVFWLCGNR